MLRFASFSAIQELPTVIEQDVGDVRGKCLEKVNCYMLSEL